MKKHIKLNFCGFWNSFNKENNLFSNVLKRYFDIEICDCPDYVIASNRGNPFEYMKYDCIRIMFMGENISPDFTCFDYCLGFDHIDFGDRYFRLPFGFYQDDGKAWIPESLPHEQAQNILATKQYFCNFIYGHQSGSGMREKMFAELNNYKKVISPGRYMNNMPNGKIGTTWLEKYDYLKKSKFTIACDSIHYPGFFTEKIIQPFQCHSIPVYFGSTTIDEDLNPKSFVWCKDEKNLKQTIEEVIYLDTCDEAYLEKLKTCPLYASDALVEKYKKLEQFLVHIFDQPLDKAGRRVRMFTAQKYEDNLKTCMRLLGKSDMLEKLYMIKKKFFKHLE